MNACRRPPEAACGRQWGQIVGCLRNARAGAHRSPMLAAAGSSGAREYIRCAWLRCAQQFVGLIAPLINVGGEMRKFLWFSLLTAANAMAAGVPGQGTWETTLLGRDIEGRAVMRSDPEFDAKAVFLFDTVLGVTWLRDAGAGGLRNWGAQNMPLPGSANFWVQNLTIGKFDSWSLPYFFDTGELGCDIAARPFDNECGYNPRTDTSALAHLFYVTLGNKAAFLPGTFTPQPSSGLTNTGSFLNLQSAFYWSATGYKGSASSAWGLDMSNGLQTAVFVGQSNPSLVMRWGDVLSPVPEQGIWQYLALGLGALAFQLAPGRRRSRERASCSVA